MSFPFELFLPTRLNLLASPPQIFIIKSAAIFKPSSIEFGSTPLSDLYFASVSMFKLFAVFLIEEGEKVLPQVKSF